MSLLSAEKLTKTYRSGDIDVPALKGVDFSIEAAAFVAFVGPSGSGKSTLLNLIGCLDHPTSGTLKVLDTDIATLDRRAAARFRGEHIGFVFQDFNLIPVLTVFENVEYPLRGRRVVAFGSSLLLQHLRFVLGVFSLLLGRESRANEQHGHNAGRNPYSTHERTSWWEGSSPCPLPYFRESFS